MNLSQRLPLYVLPLFAALGACAAEPWQVGEKWVFQQEGFRPMSNPPAAVEGDRVNEVVGVTGTGAEKRWKIKQTFGTNDQAPTTSYVDADHKVHKIDMDTQATGAVSLGFSPPAPLDWPELKLGEKDTMETKLSVMGFDVPLKYEYERLPDETLTVPAGEFKNCPHVRMIVHSVNMQGQPEKIRFDIWTHPTVNGRVKEVTVTRFGAADSFTSTSALKSYTQP
jgi:hypothetical protein